MNVMEQLISFLIAASIVTQMIPEESYKKCIKFFTGLVFILLVVNAIFNGVAVFDKLNISLDSMKYLENENNEKYYEGIFNEYYGNEE